MSCETGVSAGMSDDDNATASCDPERQMAPMASRDGRSIMVHGAVQYELERKEELVVWMSTGILDSGVVEARWLFPRIKIALDKQQVRRGM